jgi:HEAT repeat protein
MVYNATGLVVHDADAHIMETPTWLRDHADPAIRELAIKYLGEQTTEEGMTVLLDVLRDGDSHMRQSALDALGPSVENDPRVRKVMTQVMETTKDPDVRQFVSDALGVALEKDKVGF